MGKRRERTCGGKRRYKDHAQAVRAMQTLARVSSRAKIPTRTYYCQVCNGHHLTSKPAR